MNDAEWRALAAQNPRRVTYPNWRPKRHWDAKAKADPWVRVVGIPKPAPIKAGKKLW